MLTYLSRARNRVGFHRHTGEGLFRGNFLTHRVNYNPHQHMALNFLALACALEAPADQIPLLKRDVRPLLLEPPQHRSSQSEQQRVLELVQRRQPRIDRDSTLLIFNPDPGEAIPIRGWPEQRFAEVASALLDEYPGYVALVVGVARSAPFAERFLQRVGNERCADLTGATTTLDELLTLFELAKLLVTNDSRRLAAGRAAAGGPDRLGLRLPGVDLSASHHAQGLVCPALQRDACIFHREPRVRHQPQPDLRQ